ncbi:MAG: polyprenyl synthetase family protein, partial [Bacteroidales bacterium]|nr:polyprenyl synthetase family protein [Bacteroidales bacterium]
LFSDKIDNSIIAPAMALEIFHGFNLIHDDIMDGAGLRRNQVTVHKKWNENTAILSGDVMCIKSYQYLAQCPPEKLQELLSLFTLTAAQVCEGQQIDMDYEQEPYITMEDYIGMIALKTAVLIACAARSGALIADASQKRCESLYDYGYQLGLAFQIKDDYLDSFGDSAIFGKNIGSDIVSNKKTWLMVYALKQMDATRKRELFAMYDNPDVTPREKISRVLALYELLGVKSAAEKAIEEYFSNAVSCIDNPGFTSDQKERLIRFGETLIRRER